MLFEQSGFLQTITLSEMAGESLVVLLFHAIAPRLVIFPKDYCFWPNMMNLPSIFIRIHSSLVFCASKADNFSASSGFIL